MGDHAGAALPDRSPLLPRGVTVFTDLPVHALVLDALGPVIHRGVLRVAAPQASAALLIRDGVIAECHLHRGSERHSGPWVLEQAQGMRDGVASAERYDRAQLDLCASLLRGDIVYDDLRLEWTDWTALLGDLSSRDGGYAVELSTPSGRAVACIVDGQQTVSYTDIDPALGDPSLLEAMADGASGWVRVRALRSSPWPGERPASASTPADHRDAAPVAVTPTPLPAIDAPETTARPSPDAAAPLPGIIESNGTPTPDHDELGADEAPRNPAADLPHIVAAAIDQAGAVQGLGVLLPDMSWAAPWQVAWRPDAVAAPADGANDGGDASAPGDGTFSEGGATPGFGEGPSPEPIRAQDGPPRSGQFLGEEPPSAPATVADVREQLHAIAQRCLHRSSSRVESALQAADAQNIPLDQALRDLRALSIRGVMQPTIDAMVDEMAAVGRSPQTL